MSGEHILNTERRHGEADRREMPQQSESSGNTKWIMGMVATLLVGVIGGWYTSLNKTIPELQIGVAVLQVDVKYMAVEMARLTKVIEKLSADQEDERRRAK